MRPLERLMTDETEDRQEMVERQIARRGIRDPLVLKAMAQVPRTCFVPRELAQSAYLDRPLPIGAGQTISQPYVVALMIEAMQLKGDEKVLEVGAGSGYAAAVLGRIAHEVYAIERIASLARLAKKNLAQAGCKNVHIKHDDGTQGWPEKAPFGGILVSAGAPALPQALKQQLSVGGRLVIPVGDDPHAQSLLRVTRTDADAFTQEDLGEVRFVPLIGAQGWAGDEADQAD